MITIRKSALIALMVLSMVQSAVMIGASIYWYRGAEASHRGDINRDGRTDALDLSILLHNWTK